MQLAECPSCGHNNSVSRAVPEPGSRAETTICDHCQQAFSYHIDELYCESEGRAA